MFHIEKDVGNIKLKLAYPGIVYKTYPNEAGDPIGITCFYDGIPTRYAKVVRSKEPRHECYTF